MLFEPYPHDPSLAPGLSIREVALELRFTVENE
jgi:hypothetical protein